MFRLAVFGIFVVACGDAPIPKVVEPSNITAKDYVGPETCGECHSDQYTRWSQSLHRKMNQRAGDPGAVIGAFDGTTITYKGRTATFAPGPTMILDKTSYRITRTIGLRGLQEYVGIADGDATATEVRLPFGFWPANGGWHAQIDFDPWLDEATFDPTAKQTEPWAERCPWCHSTYPFAQRIARSTKKQLGHGLEQFFTMPGGSDRLAVEQQVTTGISCESCHLGGRDHAAGGPIHFVPTGVGITPAVGAPKASTFQYEKRDPAIVNTVCAQCHSGPSPRLSDGSALRNSSEAIDLAGSACRGIRCTDCHDPHRADARRDVARSIDTCVRCHAAQATNNHGKHGADQATCLDCHMPPYVLGIDGFVRSHRISKPRTIDAEEPNACGLCHVGFTRDRIATALLPTAPLDTDPKPIGMRWLASPSPAMRSIAIAAYGRTHDRKNLPTLESAATTDPVPYVRAFARIAIHELQH